MQIILRVKLILNVNLYSTYILEKFKQYFEVLDVILSEVIEF